MATVEEQVVKALSKEVMKNLDIPKMAAQMAPKIAAAIEAEIIKTINRNWDFADLLVDVVDGNRELQKNLSAKIAKVFS